MDVRAEERAMDIDGLFLLLLLLMVVLDGGVKKNGKRRQHRKCTLSEERAALIECPIGGVRVSGGRD